MGTPAESLIAREHAAKVDEMARRIVAEDVRYCVSSLISTLSQRDQDGSDGIDPDDLLAVAWRQPDADDFRDAAPADVMVFQDACEPHRWHWQNNADEAEDGDAPSWDNTETGAWREAFESMGLDLPDGSECYEHWLVTDWLAAKLKAHGEAVADDIAGLTVWGRCTSGQAIYADSIIQRIARDILEA